MRSIKRRYLDTCKINVRFFFVHSHTDLYFRIIGKYIRQTQNKLQASSYLKNEEFAITEKNPPLLEKMMLQSIHSDDISTLLMDMMILGVQAVMRE